MVTIIENYIKNCLEEIGMAGEINPAAIEFYKTNPDQLKLLTFEELVGIYFALKDKSNEEITS
jgi:hypothetical protein